MARFRNHYACTECGQHWIDEWSCACDDRCSNCNTSMQPYFYEELEEAAEADEETEEEHAVRLARISEEVKADMKAGRYRHGQLRPDISAKQAQTLADYESKREGLHSWQREIMQMLMTRPYGSTISGRYTRKDGEGLPFHELYGSKISMITMDECHHIKPEDYWLGYDRAVPEKSGSEKDGPKKMYWSQPIPEKGSETPPSAAKRAKLRAKRKKHK